MFNLIQGPRSDETKRQMCSLVHIFHSSDDATILVHGLSDDERLVLPTLVPRIDLCVFALSFSARPFTDDAARGIIVSPSRNS